MMIESRDLRAVAKALNALQKVIDTAPRAGFRIETVDALEEAAINLARIASEVAKRMGTE